MRKLKGLLIISFITIFSISAYAQSLSKLSDIQLEAKKQEAIVSENFELANQIKIEQDSRRSIDDKLKEKNKELTIALQQEDFAKAEILKKEIVQLEKDKAKLLTLEEDKKIAIFEEDYDKVIALDTEINNLKRGTTTPIATAPTATITNNNQNTTSNAVTKKSALLMMTTTNTAKGNTKSIKSINLSDIKYSDRVISRIGMGIKTYEYTETYYDYYTYSSYNTYYSESIFSLNYMQDRWWVNKYIVGGWNIDYGISDYGSLNYGAQMTALGDFDAIILPYTSFGVGFGFRLWEEEIYLPIVYRLGANLFFNKQRSVGLFTEFNLYLNNEYMPKLRFGIVWSSIKKRAKR